MVEPPAAAALSPVVFFLIVAGDRKQKHASILDGQRETTEFIVMQMCDTADNSCPLHNLQSRFLHLLFKVAMAMPRVLVI